MHKKQTFYYHLQPGDATCYNFSCCFLLNTEMNPSLLIGRTIEEYSHVLSSINMPAGSGAAIIPIKLLSEIHTPGYFQRAFYCVQTHGWEHVYPYTAAAVLLALSHLISFPADVDAAAHQMLQAGDYMLQLDKK